MSKTETKLNKDNLESMIRTAEYPLSTRVLAVLLSLSDNTTTVVIKNNVLAKMVGCTMSTLSRAVIFLKQNKIIEHVQDDGTSFFFLGSTSCSPEQVNIDGADYLVRREPTSLVLAGRVAD